MTTKTDVVVIFLAGLFILAVITQFVGTNQKPQQTLTEEQAQTRSVAEMANTRLRSATDLLLHLRAHQYEVRQRYGDTSVEATNAHIQVRMVEDIIEQTRAEISHLATQTKTKQSN